MEEIVRFSVRFCRLILACLHVTTSHPKLNAVLSILTSCPGAYPIPGIRLALQLVTYKIGFPGWPEPILDSVTGFGASIEKEGACTSPLFHFYWRLRRACEKTARHPPPDPWLVTSLPRVEVSHRAPPHEVPVACCLALPCPELPSIPPKHPAPSFSSAQLSAPNETSPVPDPYSHQSTKVREPETEKK